jgi:tRNA pseudouridine32 synthase/23S rRNA pseudouridine746 synthase
VSYQIVFQNAHFIIVDKSANVLSVPSRLGTKEQRPILGLILERDLNQKVYPVHRLDFEVQGLIMFALTPKAQSAANAWFEHKSVEKVYCAITSGNNEFKVNDSYEWKCSLLKGKKRSFESPHGKISITRAQLEFIDDTGFFHWEMRPITGRSHQLRFELFRHGMPIVGDALYGSTEIFSEAGIALKAFKIDFSKVTNHKDFLLPENICSKKFE